MAVKCDKCLRAFSQERYFKSAIPPRCGCGGLIRPDIVLFGETLPEGFQKLSKEDFQTADLVIIMGTSLKVQPFALLPKRIKPGCALLVIDREFPQSLQLHRQVRGAKWLRASVRALRTKFSGTKLRRHVFLAGDCDTSVRWLMEEVGWFHGTTSL